MSTPALKFSDQQLPLEQKCMRQGSSFPNQYRAVVIGSTGGIGSAFMELLRSDPSCGEVIGLSRTSVLRIDLLNEKSIQDVAGRISESGPVHLVINATGFLHDDLVKPEKSLNDVDAEKIATDFAVNAIGPLLLIKHFLPLFPFDHRCVFATLSARVGSISDNRLGGWYGYRASKAALNMFVKTAAIEFARKRPNSICLALHPGTVKTGLSEGILGSRKAFTPFQSATMLMHVIRQSIPENSGGFYAYDGSSIPW